MRTPAIVLLLCLAAIFFRPEGTCRNLGPSGTGQTILRQKKSAPPVSSSIDSLITACLAEISADSIKSTMLGLQGMGTRFMLQPNRKQVAEWVRGRFMALGYQETVIDSFYVTSSVQYPTLQIDTSSWQYNVTATLASTSNPSRVFVAGAHYDCMNQDNPWDLAPGADDNGSGTAAVLEMARVMKKMLPSPPATIKFVAFAAEELMYYSDSSGAIDFVARALAQQEDIVLAVIGDMISNETEGTSWDYNMYQVDKDHWTTQLALEVCDRYTSLSSTLIEQPLLPGDGEPFGNAGFPALWIAEQDFSPNYHSSHDVVDSCNLDYCAEMTRMMAGTLLWGAAAPLPVMNYYLASPGDGCSLRPCWQPNQESDLAGYKVYIGRQPGIYDSVVSTTDTSCLITGLLQDTTYYIAVTAFNLGGYESLPTEKRQAPALVTLAEGILVINGSNGGFGNPTPEDIRAFYDTLCTGTTCTHLDASNSNLVPLGVLGKYSTVIWHAETFQWSNTALHAGQDELRSYMDLGGHCLFTLYEPGRLFMDDDGYPFTFTKGSFMYDALNLAGSENEINRWFSGATPLGGFDSLYINPVKMPSSNSQIPLVEVFTPADGAEVIFLYDSKYDSASPPGSYTGRPVGILNKGSEKNMVLLSFPLYYINTGQAADFAFDILHDKFHENYVGIEEQTPAPVVFHATAFPNPASGVVSFSYELPEEGQVDIRITDLQGRTVLLSSQELQARGRHVETCDVSGLAPGMYVCRIKAGRHSFTGKIALFK
jgi:hypothetical protein